MKNIVDTSGTVAFFLRYGRRLKLVRDGHRLKLVDLSTL